MSFQSLEGVASSISKLHSSASPIGVALLLQDVRPQLVFWFWKARTGLPGVCLQLLHIGPHVLRTFACEVIGLLMAWEPFTSRTNIH